MNGLCLQEPVLPLAAQYSLPLLLYDNFLIGLMDRLPHPWFVYTSLGGNSHILFHFPLPLLFPSGRVSVSVIGEVVSFIALLPSGI